jgi:SAM-dependent methyltransferase
MKLNLGCGSRFLPNWVNCDFQSNSQKVVAHDLRNPLPFPNENFQVVYHSHVLEHLKPSDARRFLAECQRVLRPGGLLRTVIPDLEQRARIYLHSLEEAKTQKDPSSISRHEWMILELVDQHVRDKSGGEMVDFILSGKEKEFVRQRLGDEYNHVLRHGKTARPQIDATQRWSFRSSIRKLLKTWAKKILKISDADLVFLQFERLGERHRWMYDRLSIRSLLHECGFEDIREVDAFSSQAPDWREDGLWLDVEDDEARKPDSIYFEATKR